MLDNQLQDTVYQFDHVASVVQKIDKNARQLKEAIEAGTDIITTLQKFPVIYKEVKSGSRRFAVIALDEYRVYKQMEIEKFAKIFYSGTKQTAGDLGALQGTLKPAMDRYAALEGEKKDQFKTTLARFNRIYAFITQVYRMFDREIHQFSVYAKFLAMMLPKGDTAVADVDDKVMLEYYRLEKDFEGGIGLEGTAEGFTPITGEAGRKEKKKDPLTIITHKINGKLGTNFIEMDKVLLNKRPVAGLRRQQRPQDLHAAV